RRAGGEVEFTDIFVTHSGYDHSPAGQVRKMERDLRILHKELAERPGHPFTLFNLGMTYADKQEYAKAADYLRQSIAHSTPEESHLRKAYALLVHCEAQGEQRDKAWSACRAGLSLFPNDVELRFREAMLLHDDGRLTDAAKAYRALFDLKEERHFSSRDRGIAGFKARQNLAVVYTDMGDLAAAEAEWRKVVAEMPAYRAGWRGLGDVLLRRGRLAEARALAKQLLQEPALRCEGMLLEGHAACAAGDTPAARAAFSGAVAAYPDDPEALQTFSRFLFEQGAPAEAEAALQRLVQWQPRDAAAHHNLGTVYLSKGHYSAAVEAYRESLRHRPKSPATLVQLGHALREIRCPSEALAAWRQALELAPGYPAAAQAIRAAEAGQIGKT
ncbi:MAG TPA: tetratricopeptide repeat protein, partial [Gemmataceae bacterium]|nr:tetratricopeptide repeat protein [Gemmataceae bacterium]